MATLKEIAAKLGVSVSTVSKGLNGADDISENLRRAILDTAVEMGYKNSRTQKRIHRKMAVFIENIEYEDEESFGYDIIMGFQKAAHSAHWGADVYPVTPAFQRENPYENYLLQMKYSGAYILGFSLEDPWMEQFRTASIPTLLLDNFIPENPNLGSIGTDSEEAFEMAVSHLVALRHEKIAFLNGSSGSLISDQRMACYLQSMSRHHLQVDPNLAVYGFFVADSARYHVPGMIARGATAFLCGNDLIAAGVMECCRGLGYSIPEDISVIGFDDIPLAEKLDPPLTTLCQNRFELGKSGFYSLQAMVDHVPLSKSLLRPTLIVRSSTAIAKPRLAEPYEADPDSIIFKNPVLLARYT
ncbi:MAG: LacI family DNA-binding transcriptional regulator [Lachnospiraceae bacterium]|nr:LacI family DNA-binding transcriptional regulator [Lachnospiraceae bacterium]